MFQLATATVDQELHTQGPCRVLLINMEKSLTTGNSEPSTRTTVNSASAPKQHDAICMALLHGSSSVLLIPSKFVLACSCLS